MARSFLEHIDRAHPGGHYPGDEFGGGAGHSGSGLPTHHLRNFLFATGIECSYPKIGHGAIRRDLLEECGHYKRWREDLELVRDLGLKVLRYGLPYYAIHRGPGRYEWGFADEVMEEIRRLELTPILDLMHFGLPDWLGDYQNPELPVHFEAYCDAVAERYPWVRFFTPVNEMYVTARISARDGHWNEQLKTDTAFITALKHVVSACILGCHAIARRRQDAVIVHCESAEFWHEAKAITSREVAIRNKARLLSLDLLFACPPDAEALTYAMDSGLTREEYEWFMAGEPPGYQILGNDYYGRNERIVKPDGSTCQGEDVLGWYQITKGYYDRYKKPVFYSETNTFDEHEAPQWLWKQWVNVLRMRQDGVPVLGFTWYSLTDQVDWDKELAVKAGDVNACGLYDLDRKPRPVEREFRALLREFGQITIVPHAEMLEITDEPAKLKVEI